MTALLSRWLRPRPRAAHLAVRVYTREQCCCCHTAIDLLRDRQKAHGYAIETIDVDADPAIAERYGLEVPVVEVGGKVRFRGVVNPVLLDRLLAAEADAGRGR